MQYFKKNPTLTQDLSRRCIATRGGEHLHTLEDRDAEALKERGWWSRTRCDSDRGRFRSKRRTDGASTFNTRTARGRLLLLDPARGEEKLRENSSSMTAWWRWSSWFSGRASPGTTEEEEEEEEVLEEGEGCARGEVRLPSHPSTIYRGKRRGRGALGFPLGAAAKQIGSP